MRDTQLVIVAKLNSNQHSLPPEPISPSSSPLRSLSSIPPAPLLLRFLFQLVSVFMSEQWTTGKGGSLRCKYLIQSKGKRLRPPMLLIPDEGENKNSHSEDKVEAARKLIIFLFPKPRLEASQTKHDRKGRIKSGILAQLPLPFILLCGSIPFNIKWNAKRQRKMKKKRKEQGK